MMVHLAKGAILASVNPPDERLICEVTVFY
jgi:hypothetical protein